MDQTGTGSAQCSVLLEHMASLNLLDEEATGDSFLRKYASIWQIGKYEKGQPRSRDKLLYQQATPERVTQPKVLCEKEEKKHKSAFLSGGSPVDRAVQAAFSTIDIDNSSKLTGDLSKAPSFDI